MQKQIVLDGWNKRTCTCVRQFGEIPVHGDMSYTPAQMYEAAKAGIAINNQNVSSLPPSDFADENSWLVPIEFRRNVDIADVWNEQRDARSKVMDAHRKSLASKKEPDGE